MYLHCSSIHLYSPYFSSHFTSKAPSWVSVRAWCKWVSCPCCYFRRQAKHTACIDNHGIRPPTPEQYLTPLQQKEVCIRHLRARLRDNVERLQHRWGSLERGSISMCDPKTFLYYHEVFFQICRYKSVLQKCDWNTLFAFIHHWTRLETKLLLKSN